MWRKEHLRDMCVLQTGHNSNLVKYSLRNVTVDFVRV
jgi:hypothetical protein